MLVISSIILSLATAITIGYLIWLYRRPEVFTRDRFAFAGLAAIASLSGLTIATVAGHTPWQILIGGLRWATAGEFRIDETHWEGQFLMAFCVFVAAYTITK